MAHTGLGEYFTQVFNGVIIRQRKSDGFVDATAMCRVGKGKKMNAWRMNKTTNLYLVALSGLVGIPACDLIQSSKTRSDVGGGSWVHPHVAIHLAMWISPIFATEVVVWTSRYLSGDRTLASEVIEMADRVSGTKTITTSTTAPKQVFFERKGNICELHNSISQHHTEDLRKNEISDNKMFLKTYVSETKTGIRARSLYIDSRRKIDELLCTLERSEKQEDEAKHVYFIRMEGTSFVKVGFSGDIFQRMKALRTANPLSLTLEYSYETIMYAEIEHELHQLCSDSRVSGEWFELDEHTNYRALLKSAIANIDGTNLE